MGKLTRSKWHIIFTGEFDPADLVNRKSPHGPLHIAVEGDAEGTAWSASVTFQGDPTMGDDDARWSGSSAWRFGEQTSPQAEIDFKATAPAPLLRGLGSAQMYHFDARQIAAAAYSRLTKPDVKFDGSQTAAVLAALKLEQDEAFNRVQEELRRIVPSVERIRIRRARVEMPSERVKVMGHKVYLDFRGAPGVPAHAASEGTLITLALLTVLHSPRRPRLLLLDDIDQSLHPHAQIELVRELRRLLEEFPDLQIVATTHSPYVLDELDPRDVVVFALRADGIAAHKRLSEHPEAAKGVLTAGQIWSLDPEKAWVAEEKA
jgi:hypothetical protein